MAFGLIERINEDLYNQGLEKGFEKCLEKDLEKTLEKGLEKLVEKLLERGLEKERFKFYKAIQKALTLGLPIPQVATIFGLSEEDVQNIRP